MAKRPTGERYRRTAQCPQSEVSFRNRSQIGAVIFDLERISQ